MLRRMAVLCAFILAVTVLSHRAVAQEGPSHTEKDTGVSEDYAQEIPGLGNTPASPGDNVGDFQHNGGLPLTNLFHATAIRDVTACRWLLEHSKDPQSLLAQRNDNGETPLLEGVRLDRRECVILFFEYGADIAGKDQFGNTTLFWAAKNGNLEIARLILSTTSGRNIVNAPGSSGTPPIFGAAENGSLDMMRLLAENGADVSIRDEHGTSVLTEAAVFGKREVVKYLRELGEEYTLCDAASLGDLDSIRSQIQERRDLVSYKSSRGDTPLHSAASAGQADVIRYLLRAGAIVDATVVGGATALYFAAAFGHVEAAQVLLENGADPNGFGKYHPLNGAAHIRADSMMVDLLLKHGAKVNAESPGGRTPLGLAMQNGDEEKIRLLKEHGAILSPADKRYFNMEPNEGPPGAGGIE